MVPWFRSCGLATTLAASARATYRLRTTSFSTISVMVVMAPSRRPPSLIGVMPRSSGMPLSETTASVAKTRSRRQPMRSVPPPWIRAPLSSRIARTSLRRVGTNVAELGKHLRPPFPASGRGRGSSPASVGRWEDDRRARWQPRCRRLLRSGSSPARRGPWPRLS